MLRRQMFRMSAVIVAMIAALTTSLLASSVDGFAATRPSVSSVSPVNGDYYKLVNLSSGWCLYDYKAGYAAGLDNCVQGATDEKWKWQATSTSGYFKLVNLSSGRCLDYQNGYAAPDACAQGSTTQKWRAQATSTSGYFKLVNLYLTPQLCADGDVVTVYVDPCAQGSNTEKWLFQSASS
jgi:hypothetical protein